MLAFGRTVRDEEAIFDAGVERLRVCARHYGFHAANVLPVIEWLINRNRVCVGNQMPERQHIFIGLPFVQHDDFDFREFAWLPQFKNDRNRGRISSIGTGEIGPPVKTRVAGVDAGNVNDLGLEPVGEVKNINAGQRERDSDQKPIFSCHKI